jgi:hypothetical protein
MASNWYYEENGDRQGPVDSKTLKQLAGNGTIKSTTPVWREGMKDWVKAGSVKGLISSSPTNPTRPPVPNSVVQPSTSPENAEEVTEAIPQEAQEKLWHRWPLVALLVTCCFPVGLVLVWTHPRWTTVAKTLWTAGFLAVAILGQTISHLESRALAEKLTHANQLWEEDRQSEAVSIYRRLITDGLHKVAEEDRSLLLQRTVTFEAENGNTEIAMEMLDDAELFRVPLSFDSQAARDLVAQRNQQKEQERQEQEALRREQETEKFAREADQSIAEAGRHPTTLSQAGTFSDDQRVQFKDNTSRYAGKAVRMVMQYSRVLPNERFRHSDPSSLIVAEFKVYSFKPVATFEIVIDIPTSIDTPPLGNGDEFEVTFFCGKGSTAFGNKAISIRRP